MTSIHRAPHLRWRAPSFLAIAGFVCLGFFGVVLFEVMEEEQVREALFNPDAEAIERSRAAELWANGGAESLPRLKEALASADASTREFGLLALIYMSDESAVLLRSDVQTLCDDPDVSVQANALVLMAKLTDEPEEFAKVAAARLKSSDRELVDAGITGVRRLGSSAIPALVEVLPHVRPMVQRIVLNLLGRHAFNEQHGSLAVQAIADTLHAEDEEVRESAYTLMWSIRPLTAEEIGAGLKDRQGRIVAMALSEAVRSESRAPANLRRLLWLLKAKPKFRVSALKAIAVYGAQASGHFSEVQQWTEDSDPRVRLETVTALVRITEDFDRVIPFLQESLLDSHPEVARRSAQLLGEVAPERIPATISQVLLPRLASPNLPTQVSAAAALSALPEAAAAHRLTLIRLLADESAEFAIAPALQFQLTEALGNMGPAARDAVPVLLGLVQRADLNDPQLVVPVEALGKIAASDPIVLQTLLQLHEQASHRSRRLRIAILEAFGKLGRGNDEIFELLASRTQLASHPRERLAALRAMAACRTNPVATLAILSLALSDENPNIRLGACLLLAEQEDVEEVVPNLALLLEDENYLVRLGAARSLATLGAPARAAELALLRALNEPANSAAYGCGAEGEEVDGRLFETDVENLPRGSVRQAVQSALAAMENSQNKTATDKF